MTHPSAPVGDGRSPSGRFAPGNKHGRGNPHAKAAQRLRAALYDAVSEEDLCEVVQMLVREAKEGSVQAAKELLSRILGPPESIDFLSRIEELEALFERLAQEETE